jgi:hypothetical protein
MFRISVLHLLSVLKCVERWTASVSQVVAMNVISQTHGGEGIDLGPYVHTSALKLQAVWSSKHQNPATIVHWPITASTSYPLASVSETIFFAYTNPSIPHATHFNPEVWGSKLLRNVNIPLQVYKTATWVISAVKISETSSMMAMGQFHTYFFLLV